MADGNMIEIEYLNISFGRSSRTNHAVKGIDLSVKKGECFGLVGESGCGKSTLLGAIAGRLKDWRGSITIAGDQLGRKKRNHDQLRRQQMVFQDPFGSLHPRHTIGGILMEPLVIHGIADHEERVEKALDQVGLLPRNEFLRLLQVKGADLIQPDICVVGGISEMRRIAALAEAYFVGVAPHNPMGPLASGMGWDADRLLLRRSGHLQSRRMQSEIMTQTTLIDLSRWTVRRQPPTRHRRQSGRCLASRWAAGVLRAIGPRIWRRERR